MDRDQMITHLTLLGWQPCGFVGAPETSNRIVNTRQSQVIVDRGYAREREMHDPDYELPDSNWERYTSTELEKFITTLD